MPDTPDTPTPICTSDLPGRLDRLPWSRFHTRVVIALGITWLLDGLEVTLAGAVAGALAAIQARWGTAAERRPLEHVAAPLSADDGPGWRAPEVRRQRVAYTAALRSLFSGDPHA
ncbi:hypothetical protein LMG10661_02164 [Ralstonia syzygii subsp. syzygii]|nr:hypothetical protein LMG10661_02164 [Ralstonia syzygii subsp. syzygii]